MDDYRRAADRAVATRDLTTQTEDPGASSPALDHEMSPGTVDPRPAAGAGLPIDSVARTVAPAVSPAPDGPPAVESMAAIDGHPLHPAVVPLPIGAFVGAAAADAMYAWTGERFWARGARYLTGAGIATGVLAGVLGAVDFVGREPVRRYPAAWIHAAGNLAVIGLAGVSLVARARDERGAARSGLVVSLLNVGILGATGWLGGELAFRHRIGVTRTA